MKLRRLPKGTWLHRDAPDAVDVGTWCLVPTGDPLLTRRARACSEYGHVLMQGYAGATAPFGGLVRHWDFAEQLDRGTPSDVISVATRLHLLGAADRAGVALAGSYRLAAAVIAQRAAGDWVQGADRAVATGTDAADAGRRRQVYEAFSAVGSPVTDTDVELWDGYAVAYGVRTVVLAIRAGYTAREITPEQLADPSTLAVAAALNGHNEPVNA